MKASVILATCAGGALIAVVIGLVLVAFVRLVA